MLPRRVQVELLDGLPANDPTAEQSRRDLRRVHRVMGTRALLVRTLRQLRPTPSNTLRVLELGAGDGSLMLGVARELAPEWPAVDLTLLDRVALVNEATITEYARQRWTARPKEMDVLDWARAAAESSAANSPHWDLVIANLFLHHFDVPELTVLLAAIAARTDALIACEPRRGWRALAGSHLIGGLGVNAVTRTDAVLSVHAGFRDRELTKLWPRPADWNLQEHPSGPFLHYFRAMRRRTH